MKKALSAFAALLLFICFSGHEAQAQAQTIMIHNNTGNTIVELYASNADTNSWEEDVLGRDVLEAGDTLRLKLSRNYMVYDLMARFKNGDEHIYNDINVRRYSNIRLNRHDADLY